MSRNAAVTGSGAHSLIWSPTITERSDAILSEDLEPDAVGHAMRRVVLVVALLNLGYFGIEFAAATATGSVSLFADSVDFFEDASINLLILLALGWGAKNRAQVAKALAAVLLVPSAATLWTAWQKMNLPVAPDPLPLSLTALGALAVNLTCTLLFTRYLHHRGSLTTAAFLSARNDAFANIAILVAAFSTAIVWRSAWPDLIVGLGIATMSADAARDGWKTARMEHRAAA